jgi:hypothetical protein
MELKRVPCISNLNFMRNGLKRGTHTQINRILYLNIVLRNETSNWHAKFNVHFLEDEFYPVLIVDLFERLKCYRKIERGTRTQGDHFRVDSHKKACGWNS